MPSSWKWKLIAVLASALVGVYLLIPTLGNFGKIWEDAETKGAPPPWYLYLFPKKVLNLGLDLRGGIYVEMEVDVDSAIKRKTDLMINDIQRSLKGEKITPINITQPKGDGVLHIRLASASDLEETNKIISSDFDWALAKTGTATEDGHPTLIVGVTKNYRGQLATNSINQALEVVRSRIDRYGVAEPSITKAGKDRIAIELPGISDPQRAINIIKRTGQLEFRLLNESKSTPEIEQLVDEARKTVGEGFSLETANKINETLAGKIPQDSEILFELVRDPITKRIVNGVPYLVNRKAEVTGDMLEDALVQVQDNEPNVSLTFDKTGAELFANLTKANVGKRLAIILDGYVNKAPVIREPILNGRAQITFGIGDYHALLKEAEDLTLILQEGALPATLTEATKTIVGPTLGHDTIKKGVQASLIGALLVLIFMIAYYKFSGSIADVALALNVILILAVLSLFRATLTLPGIAGIALTIGMAVDANILICERIREELRHAKSPRQAVESGYSNALRAVIDSNITTLIAGIILYQFGTGPIKGFAVTLSVGILTTLFSAVIVTRLVYDYLVIKRKVTRISI